MIILANSKITYVVFQSTSSEEDVVSRIRWTIMSATARFNPRPPKRTLCPHVTLDMYAASMFQSTSSEEDVVSLDTESAR